MRGRRTTARCAPGGGVRRGPLRVWSQRRTTASGGLRLGASWELLSQPPCQKQAGSVRAPTPRPPPRRAAPRRAAPRRAAGQAVRVLPRQHQPGPGHAVGGSGAWRAGLGVPPWSEGQRGLPGSAGVTPLRGSGGAVSGHRKGPGPGLSLPPSKPPPPARRPRRPPSSHPLLAAAPPLRPRARAPAPPPRAAYRRASSRASPWSPSTRPQAPPRCGR
jgi:hypothetical protein